VWVKDNGGMGSFYRSQHELVLVFRKGNGPHRNNVQLGQFGRNRTNVWQYPGIHTLSKQSGEGNLLALHPTVKPVAMVADAILDSSARGEAVLDAFLGSGTTLMAAERVGRICCGIELDPAYVDVAIRRWQNYTGDGAVHAKSGKSFDEVGVSKEGGDALRTSRNTKWATVNRPRLVNLRKASPGTQMVGQGVRRISRALCCGRVVSQFG
jgi:hypothetical protein